MNEIADWSIKDWIDKLKEIFKYILIRWYVLVLGGVAGAIYGYWPNRNIKPTYTATISFVLLTEASRGAGAGLAGLAAQLGLDAGTTGPDNIFAGDNILELFKSNKMVRRALLTPVDRGDKRTLLEHIVEARFPHRKNVLPFPADPDKFNQRQQVIFRMATELVKNSFTVFKKDKKLVFYYISATSTDSDLAYYIAKCMLQQTSKFFIDTKVGAAAKALTLLTKEADSLGRVLGGAFHTTASLADRTYNINPSLMVQRSGAQLTQAKAGALTAAYGEVMRNLEIAKINVQKETPLYSVIDEPDLPLAPKKMDVKRHAILTGLVGLFLVGLALFCIKTYNILTPLLFKNAEQ